MIDEWPPDKGVADCHYQTEGEAAAEFGSQELAYRHLNLAPWWR